MSKIFIVEDDKIIAEQVQQYLLSWGYEVKCAENFKNVTEEFVEYAPQLVLLDVSLPNFNGYHWCEEIRKRSKVPIVFLSSMSDNMNIVMAMNMGGDDFITKPFDLSVLIAKVQAMLRRTYDFQGALNILEYKGAILDINSTTVQYADKKLELTKNEFRILQMLMENTGKIVERESIMTRLWENDDFIDDNTLTVNVTRLRKKLESIGLYDYIITKKGLGYIIK